MTYFDWLVYQISPDYHMRERYSELLFALYSTEFFWALPRDINRAKDGLDLRKQYEREVGSEIDIFGPCTCLEMMIALAIRCENELMYDPDFGDRTDQWFWMMIDTFLEVGEFGLEIDAHAEDASGVGQGLCHIP